MAQLITHIDTNDWGHRCIGIQPNAGQNEYFVSHGAPDWPDYSTGYLAAWRHWLTKQGVADAATWTAPLPEELQQGKCGDYYNPAGSRRGELWWRFLHQLNATRLRQTCAAIKQHSQQRLLTGAFYGHIGDSYASCNDRPWLYGHHAMAEVTEDPSVDFLAAPFSYINRHAGGTPESKIPTGSCDLAGCFTFIENDLGTFWSHKNDHPDHVARSVGTMVRDQGQRIIRRQGFW